MLKAESLQRTGSFKLRGALAKIAALGPACERGVTAGSAGNHGWALSAAAAFRGVRCEVFMPEQAPLAKVEGCEALGATVRVAGESIEEALAAARRRADEAGMTFVHPFDDPVIVAGQGTLGLELLEDVPALAKVVVPVGGGGLVVGRRDRGQVRAAGRARSSASRSRRPPRIPPRCAPGARSRSRAP